MRVSNVNKLILSMSAYKEEEARRKFMAKGKTRSKSGAASKGCPNEEQRKSKHEDFGDNVDMVKGHYVDLVDTNVGSENVDGDTENKSFSGIDGHTCDDESEGYESEDTLSAVSEDDLAISPAVARKKRIEEGVSSRMVSSRIISTDSC